MAGMVGMNVEEVRALATQLNQASEQIKQISSTLTSKLGSTTWVGPDQARFKGEWEGTHATNLRQVAEALNEASRNATTNANEQEQVSR